MDEELRDLIAAQIRDAVAEEREACARTAETHDMSYVHRDGTFADEVPERIAAAIRARG